jgi:hypothetical protein
MDPLIKSKNDLQEQFTGMMDFLTSATPSNWTDITNILQSVKSKTQSSPLLPKDEFIELAANGTAFYTFGYGIDGVSMEIVKYAQALESLYQSQGRCAIYLIGGRFSPQADSLMNPGWIRHNIDGIQGWARWDQGKWFQALFYEDLPKRSKKSASVAKEIFSQAVDIAKSLGNYLLENNIRLLIPVNVASNPGNMASSLALVLVSEALGLYVINSNHDFYWEGGKPKSKRKPGKRIGSRDHFFRNSDNKPFFKVFEALYPWDGDRWLQVNINKRQSRKLVRAYGFSKKKIFEISTSISDRFFESYSDSDVKLARIRMAYILSGGEAILHPIPIEDHIADLKNWAANQTPCILGHRAGLSVDPRSDEVIWFLQPTRIIPRKRIGRNLELIGVLLADQLFRKYFNQNTNRKIILHITGPTPRDHYVYLKQLLQKFNMLTKSLPLSIADRIFLAFSVGREDHPSLRKNNLQPLSIEEIYRMASMVLFPSSREGRGLPIIESSASGIPILCRRYRPVTVFDEVIGKGLSEEKQIYYTPFPEEDYNPTLIEEIVNLLIHPQLFNARKQHNKDAVRLRYSRESLTKSFEGFFEYFCTPGEGFSKH